MHQGKDGDMYHHAKMAHIASLKKKLMALMAEDHDPSAMHPNAGLGEPTNGPADLAMSPHHGMAAEDSPEEEAGESPGEEAAEGPEDDEMTAMKKAYFKPKPRAPRPGTAAIMVGMKAPPSKGKFGKGKM